METIVGFVQEVSGHTFDIIYDLYFTEHRFIGVLIQHPGEGSNYSSLFSLQNIVLGNIFSKRKEQNARNELADERRTNHKNMTPSELAASHPGNYVIEYDSISRIELKSGLIGASLKIHFLDPARRTLSFGLSKKQAKEIRPTLELVLPNSKLKLN